MKRVLAGVGFLLFALTCCSIPANADTITGTLNLGAPNWNANGTLTTSGGATGSWSLAFNFVNGTANTVDINSFAVQLFNASASESFTVGSATLNSLPLSSPWQFFADTKINNGTSPTCSTNNIKGWLCVDTGQTTVNPQSILTGHTDAFVFSGTYTNGGAVNPLDLMASGCVVAGTCALDGGSNNNNKWAVSSPLIGSSVLSSPVPEPASVLLLGTGLLALGTLARRRANKVSHRPV
jgi:PEP-CTERM motif